MCKLQIVSIIPLSSVVRYRKSEDLEGGPCSQVDILGTLGLSICPRLVRQETTIPSPDY